MPVCPKCSTENGDVDFCSNCGTYLRWDPTRVLPAIQVPETPAEDEPAAPPDAAADSAPPAAPPPVASYETVSRPAAPGAKADEATSGEPFAAVLRTMDMPAVPAGPPPGANLTSAAPSVAPEAVVISLTFPEEASGAERLVVEAGGQATLPALIRNQSGIVDNYEIRVKGIPAEWWTVTPPTVYLLPFGAPGGGYEQEAEIRFQPPRSAEAEARAWEIEVVAISRAQSEEAGSVSATLVITPYEQLESELRPELASGRRKGSFAVMVRNRANAPIETEVSAVDAAGACTFTFAKQRFLAEPGRRAGTTFEVRAKKPIWVGRSADRRFELVAKAVTGEATTQPLRGVFRQRPWVPFWAPLVVPPLIAAGVLIWSLLPNNTTVPNLAAKSVAAAQIVIENAHLKLSPPPYQERPSKLPKGAIVGQAPKAGAKVKRGSVITIQIAEPRVPNLLGKNQSQAKLALQQVGLALSATPPEKKISKQAPGTIIGQLPGAGDAVRSGTQISIVVAVGTGLRKVPNVVGLKLPDAEKIIRSAGLSIILPQLPANLDPAKAIIRSQIPSAGETVKANQPVNVYIPPPVKPKPKKIPVLTGLAATAAAALLSQQGAIPVVVRRFDTAKEGDVIEQVPPSTEKLKQGEKVQLIVSAGYPQIAFSDGADVLVMAGADGKDAHAVAATSEIEDEPSWQPNGTLLAYRRGASQTAGQIWVTDTAKGVTSAHAMTAGPDDRRPAFSPNGRVIAFIRRTPVASGADGDLCFVSVASTLHQGVCVVDPNVSVDRPTWSPDGRAILAVATDPADPNQTELAEWTSARPYSASPADWVYQGLITDKMHGKRAGEGVLFAAWAPDGAQVAIVANWGADNLTLFRVFLAPWSTSGLGTPKAVVPTIRACEVSWLSDSAQLGVLQADNCSSGTGAIVRVTLSDPGTVTTLRSSASQNPAWQYVTLG